MFALSSCVKWLWCMILWLSVGTTYKSFSITLFRCLPCTHFVSTWGLTMSHIHWIKLDSPAFNEIFTRMEKIEVLCNVFIGKKKGGKGRGKKKEKKKYNVFCVCVFCVCVGVYKREGVCVCVCVYICF